MKAPTPSSAVSAVWFAALSCLVSSVACTGDLAASLPGQFGDAGASAASTGANGSGSSTASSATSAGSTSASSSAPGTGVADAGVVPVDGSSDPDCASLGAPALARICPDGAAVGAQYVLQDHACVLVYPCDAGAAPPPSGSNSSSSGAGADASTDASDAFASTDAAHPPVCNFLLPHICEVCSDGTAACAHYAIKNGRCVTEICPARGGLDADAQADADPDAQADADPDAQADADPDADADRAPDANDAAPGVVTHPVCNFALPAICAICRDGSLACAHYAIENGICVAEICPPGTTGVEAVDAGRSVCEQNAVCAPNSGCGFASTAYGGGCETSCECDGTGHLQCVSSCAPVSPHSARSEGAACAADSSCDAGIDVDGCAARCVCSGTGALRCTAACP